MIFKPAQLGRGSLEPEALTADAKACKRFGPCGVGREALYLNSFYLDCRYYLPYSGITRVFKRVAMSQGGFSHKGIFASIPYLVVEYDDGKQRQCHFKDEGQVDRLLACLAQERPEIRQVSAAVEERLAKRERERAARVQPELSSQAQESLQLLQRAEAYLDGQPALSLELSRAAQRKRAYLRSKPSYRWVAMAVTGMGLVSLLYGIYAFTRQADTAVYFTLFGLAALFLFSGANVLPTSRNNKKAVMRRSENAQEAMARYLSGFPGFPLPPRYAHPVVLRRMRRAVEAGRAERPDQALEVVKQDLKALNSSVEVDQEEYDEVVAVKAMFLNEAYQ